MGWRDVGFAESGVRRNGPNRINVVDPFSPWRSSKAAPIPTAFRNPLRRPGVAVSCQLWPAWMWLDQSVGWSGYLSR